MIDFLLAQQYKPCKIRKFLSDIFSCSVDRIKYFEIDEFNSLSYELDESEFDCVCVSSLVRGNASQLLQLYRYRVDDEYIVGLIIDSALKNWISCYIPNNPFCDWVYVGSDGICKHVCQIDCEEEDCFLFRAKVVAEGQIDLLPSQDQASMSSSNQTESSGVGSGVSVNLTNGDLSGASGVKVNGCKGQAPDDPSP